LSVVSSTQRERDTGMISAFLLNIALICVWFLRPVPRERYRGHSTFLLNIALIVFGFLDPERQGSFHVSVEHCLDCGFLDPERERDRGPYLCLLNIALIVFGFFDPYRERETDRGHSTFLLNVALSVVLRPR
jgi:uncharacterized membrane protein YqaE (UPF0057 family)